MSGQDDDLKGGQYASPPCFMHELDPEFRIQQEATQVREGSALAAFQKGENCVVEDGIELVAPG